MRNHNKIWTSILCSLVFIILILDAKTSLIGAKEGIQICIYTVIPSLFPFIILSIMISNTLAGTQIKLLRPIGKICGIPSGAETLMLLGFMGGYPIGAQNICETYRCGNISKKDAQRMLGFCNNAGPAFIFGMLSMLFENKSALWALWGIHIVSAIIVGYIFPFKSKSMCNAAKSVTITVPKALEKGTKSMALICGWVILFRVLLAFIKRWFFFLLPVNMGVLLTGLLELSNGCIDIQSIELPGLRFIFCAVILAFGGICVCMQTVSATAELGTGFYFPGKVMQLSISLLLAQLLQFIIFPRCECVNIRLQWIIIPVIIIATIPKIISKSKKIVAIQR